MKHKVINFAKRINPHRRLRSSWVAHTNEQKQHEPIIYDCGIFAIQRLSQKSDAKILFENHEKIVTWLQSTKQRYTSLSALLKAFYKATKPKSDETKSQKETEKESQDSPKSDTTEPKAQEKKQMTASDLALEVLVQLEMHNISIKDFAREINSQYKELKTPSKKVA